MPFWSYQAAGHTITYLALSDLQTELCISERSGRLSTYAEHTFRKRDGAAPYELEIWPRGESPVSPRYRNIGIAHRARRVTSRSKTDRPHPEVAQTPRRDARVICSADAGTPAFLDELKTFGRRSILARPCRKWTSAQPTSPRRKKRLPRRALRFFRQHPGLRLRRFRQLRLRRSLQIGLRR